VSNTKHTPPLVRVVDSDGSVKQTIDRADAKYMRLIAAAPDLLEALQIIANCVADSEGGTTLGSYEMGKVRAALAKAGAL
jgi:hypothetical protein